MRELKEKKVGTALGIALICLFSTIYLAISYYAIDSHLREFGTYYYNFFIRKQKGVFYMEKEKKVIDTNLGILLICLFSAVFTMADFIIIDHVLDKYVDYSKCQCEKCNVNDDGIITDNSDDAVVDNRTDDDYVTTTNIKVKVGDRDSLADVTVSDGGLSVSLNSLVKNFSIEGESIKFIYHDYYQYSNTNVIFALTEDGNVYVNEFYVYDSDIDIFNNFEKMNYENVSELKIVPNENYGVSDGAMVDNKKTYIYALIGEELVRLDNQYSVQYMY